jgi:lambda family phage portal protein
MDMPNGHQIRMGVEVDANQKPVAYHIFDGNPSEGYTGSAQRKRVPADQIIHLFISHRTGQTRGYPWFASSMEQLNMLDGYFKAELVKARVGASVVMSIETDADSPAEEIQSDGLNPDGSKAIDIGAGKAIQMPQGQHLKNNTPTHDPEFTPFVESSNRLIASGMSVAYHKLCNNLAGINYSSGRLGELEERDFWMEMQAELIDSGMEPMYDAWLVAGLMWGGIKLPLTDKERFMGDALKWEPRRWSWVDPLKDVQASTLLVQNGFETNESILNSMGRDLEEVYAQRKREQDLADSLGLKFGTDIRGEGTSEINSETDPEENDGSSGEPKDGQEKASKPKTKTKPAPAKPKARELTRGMHPANAALWDLTEDEK